MHGLLLSATEVAQILHVSRSLVYLLIHRGDILTVKVGNVIRIHPDDLEVYIYEKRRDCGKAIQDFLERRRDL